MQNKLALRVVIDILLFGSALAGAWWIVLPLGVVCAWYYKNFYELPLSAFAFDVIYATPRDRFNGFEYMYALIAVILFIIISVLKSKIRRDV
jgi:phosphoglycerol transferase MdoB-like AlkP superfamily enzyme